MDQDELKAEIRQRVDIVELISQYVPLQRAGRRLKARCPFHQEKTPSFYVDPAGGFWKCFGCGEGGDVFSFLMKIEGLTFPEAGERLAERVGLTWRSAPGGDAASRQRKLMEQANEIAASRFVANLNSPLGAGAREYLSRRGFTPDTMKKFRIGFAPQSWDNLLVALAENGINAETAAQVGLARSNDRGGHYDWFRNRVIFPIMEVGGRVIAFGGRTLDAQESAKYINSPDTPLFHKGRTIYGLNVAWRELTRQKRAVVVEGYTDVISLHQASVQNAVACMGTAMTQEHLGVLGRYVEEVILCYDADAAGIGAALRNAPMFEASGVNVRIAALPPGKDPDELVREDGPQAFEPIIASAMSVVEYSLRQLFQAHPTKDADGLSKAATEAVKVLAQVPDRTRRNAFMQRAADMWADGDPAQHEAMLGSLREEITRRRSGQRQEHGRRRQDRSFITDFVARGASPHPRWQERLERELLALALQSEAAAEQIVGLLELDHLSDPRHKRIYEAIMENMRSTERLAGHELVSSLEGTEGTKARGVELLLADIRTEDAQEVIEAATAKLRKHRLGRGMREKYVVPTDTPKESEPVNDEDFLTLQRRVNERIARGELSHDDPDFKRYQRLVASFRGIGNAGYVESEADFGSGSGADQ